MKNKDKTITREVKIRYVEQILLKRLGYAHTKKIQNKKVKIKEHRIKLIIPSKNAPVLQKRGRNEYFLMS